MTLNNHPTSEDDDPNTDGVLDHLFEDIYVGGLTCLLLIVGFFMLITIPAWLPFAWLGRSIRKKVQ